MTDHSGGCAVAWSRWLGGSPRSRTRQFAGRPRRTTHHLELAPLLPTLQIVNNPVQVMIKLGRVGCACPAYFFDNWITHRSLLQELFRRTQHPRFIAKLTDSFLNLRTYPCVGNMSTVPGNEVFHSVGCGDADVQRVTLRLSGQGSFGEKTASHDPAFLGDFQQRHIAQKAMPTSSCSHITASSFLQYKRRSKDVEI